MSSFQPHLCPECLNDINKETIERIYTHNNIDYGVHVHCYCDFGTKINDIDNDILLQFYNRINKYRLSDFEKDWPRSHPDYTWRYPYYDNKTDTYYDQNPLSFDKRTDIRWKLIKVSDDLKWKKTIPIEPYIPPSPNYNFLRIFSVPYCPPLHYSS